MKVDCRRVEALFILEIEDSVVVLAFCDSQSSASDTEYAPEEVGYRYVCEQIIEPAEGKQRKYRHRRKGRYLA